MRGRNLILATVLVLAGSLGPKLWAQPLTTPVNLIPDCMLFFDFSANASSASFDNRFLGCKTWYVAYTSTGFPGLTLTLQSAPDASGVPGAWVAFAGLLIEGVNPNVALTQGSTIMYGYYPWNRVTLTGAAAGAGRRIRGTFYGYRQTPVATLILPPGITVTADQGLPAVQANRWPVFLSDGVNAQGLVANPFFSRLSDGAAAQGVVANPLFNRLSDGAAAQGVVANPLFARLSDGAAAQGTQANPLFNRLSDGANPFGTQTNPVFGRLTDGTNPVGTTANPLAAGQEYFLGATAAWTPAPACNSYAAITIAGAGTTQIVALSGATQIRICHLSLSLTGATNITVVQGTGANCVTGPANITGAYTNILGLALDLDGRSLVTAAAGQAVCVTNSAAVTGGGFVTYTQY